MLIIQDYRSQSNQFSLNTSLTEVKKNAGAGQLLPGASKVLHTP
jgi:hypothetical protein